MRLAIFACLLSVAQGAGAQDAGVFIPNRALVILRPEADASSMAAQLFPGRAVKVWEAAKFMRVWAFDFGQTGRDDNYWENLQILAEHPMALAAQFDMQLTHRGLPYPPDTLTPNDPLFAQQWHLHNTSMPEADINAPEAWSIATGGLSAEGDTIVAAVIDRGIAYAHADLQANLWRNWADIPGDGIDNDDNGYTDDHRGWNVFSQNDQIGGAAQEHGTGVCGMLGAAGNNLTGGSGVNWQVKIMFVASSGTLSAVLQSFDYVYQARKRYNETGGASGAFVVTINCSWGVNFGQPVNAPLWCAAYDSLGAIGILSVAATANLPIDVDALGDLPTACPSDYLLSVTNLDRYNQRAPNAAWGAKNVDIGAYGHEALSTAAPGNYATVSGTSFAAPLVAGAVSLRYASPCPDLAQLALSDPAAAALWVRQTLLQAARPVADLDGITLTGGALDLSRMLLQAQDECGVCLPPVWTSAVGSAYQSLRISWINAYPAAALLRFRLAGDTAWTVTPLDASPFSMGGLLPCATYELSFRNLCADLPASAWSAPLAVTSGGCCTPPQALMITQSGSKYLSLKWEGPDFATHYDIRFRIKNGDWLHAQSPTPMWTLTDLEPCALYEVQVRSACPDSALSDWSDILTAATQSCGPCTEQNYCAAGANSAAHQWIRQIKIGDWTHQPNNNSAGYLNFASLATDAPLLAPLEAIPVQIVPDFIGAPTNQFFRLYVDYDGNGEFTDDELAFDPGFALDETAEGWIYTPESGIEGLTRMRVVMKSQMAFAQPPGACETFSFGQAIDYCVHLDSGSVNARHPAPAPFALFPNPSTGAFWLRSPTAADVLIAAYDATGRAVFLEKKQTAPDLWRLEMPKCGAGIYFLRIKDGARSVVMRIVLAG